MRTDFTFIQYTELLKQASKSGYTFLTVESYFNKPVNKCIILRHDVDRKPQRSLQMAKLEHSLGHKSSYFFRARNASFSKTLILQIKELGGEIGFHYESLCDTKGDIDKAIVEFQNDLTRFNELNVSVKSIAMHGRPTSPYDSKDMWKKYNYHELGIDCDVSLDFDYSRIFYLTDAGRSWNNSSVNRRDNVKTEYDFEIHSSSDIIKHFEENRFPNVIMLNIHPEHWAENSFQWYNIYIRRLIRNTIKKIFLRLKVI